MRKFRLLGFASATAGLLFCGAALGGSAGIGGIWIGEQSKDPVTDKQTSDLSNQGDLSLRCKNGVVDIFVFTNEPMFTVGEKQDVILRFGTEAPITIQAIAQRPDGLALMKNEIATLTSFLRADAFVVRFHGLYGSEYTMKFQSALLPNSLNLVGHVLAACDIIPFPEAEIAKAIDDFKTQAASPDEKLVTQKGRSRPHN